MLSINHVSPLNLLKITWLVWFIFFLMSPFSYINISPIFPGVTLLFLYNFMFIIGVLLVQSVWKDKLEIKKKYAINTISKYLKIKKLYRIAIILGVTGVFLRLYMRLYLQGLLSSDGLTQFRYILMESELSGGIIGVISAFLFPFGFVSLILVIYFNNFFSFRQKMWALLIGMYGIVDTILMGGRLIAVFLLLILFYVWIIKSNSFFNKKININWKFLFISLLLLIIFIQYTNYIIFSRMKANGVDMENIIYFVEEGREYITNPGFIVMLKEYNLYDFFIPLLSLIHYVIHGIFEFIRLFNHVDMSNVYLGEYEFYIYFKLFKFFGLDIVSFNTLNSVMHKTGVYTTFWGPFYLDFKFFGLFISFLFGMMAQKLFIAVKLRKMSGLLLYPYIAAIIVVSSILNALTGSSIYYLTSILISILLYKIIEIRRKDEK